MEICYPIEFGYCRLCSHEDISYKNIYLNDSIIWHLHNAHFSNVFIILNQQQLAADAMYRNKPKWFMQKWSSIIPGDWRRTLITKNQALEISSISLQDKNYSGIKLKYETLCCTCTESLDNIHFRMTDVCHCFENKIKYIRYI